LFKNGIAIYTIHSTLAGKEKALGADHTLTLNAVNNVGALYADQGKLDEAEKMYRRTLVKYGLAEMSHQIRWYSVHVRVHD